MTNLGFLAALPALLAIVGFVVYTLLGHQNRAQQITRDILAKLRRDSPAAADSLARLGPRQLAARLKQEDALRRVVDDQDFQLLSRVSHQEFVKAIVVYTLIGLLFVIGVIAFVYVQTRPDPLVVSSWHVESTTPDAKGLAVDTDDLVLTWKASGPREDIHMLLENVQTGSRSAELAVSSAEHRLVFPKGTYGAILRERALRGVNRIRAVARTSPGAQISEEFELRVGIRILVIPVEEDSAFWLSAMIDNGAIQNYAYDAKIVVWPKKAQAPLSFGDAMKNPKTVFTLSRFADIDFSTLKIAYFGPDDPRIVRTEVMSQ